MMAPSGREELWEVWREVVDDQLRDVCQSSTTFME